MHCPRFLVLGALAALAWTSASASQAAAADRRPRPIVVPPRPFSVHQAHVWHDRVVVKFREGVAVRLTDGRFVCLEGGDLEPVHAILGACRIERLFTRPVEELDRERAELQPKVPPDEEPLADLNNYYRVWTSGARETERLVDTLNGNPWIETAYAEFIPVPAEDIPPPTPSFGSLQTYMGPAPSGVGFLAVESIVGARFQDGRLAHLEGGWIMDHEDCEWLAQSSHLGIPPTPEMVARWANHGTACVGVLAASRNSYGVRGMASDAKEMFLVSMNNGGANMVNLAAARLGPGDVMSSSFVYQPKLTPERLHAPRDFPQADFDAVRAAATKGIHYTFSAGNSRSNIETAPALIERYSPQSLSSGGYIVGAIRSAQPVRFEYSNWGPTHVIAAGWGENVASLGWGHLFGPANDPRQYYTHIFGGTSAAAAQVGAVIASFVGAVREQTGRILTVDEVKEALRATGTPVVGGIGNLPDLQQLLARYGLPEGLLVIQNGPPGGEWTYEVTGQPGESASVLFAPERGDTPLGLNRPLLIAPQSFVVLETSPLSSRPLERTVPIPNEPVLHDTDFYLQVMYMEPGGGLRLSNSATLWIQ